MNSLLNVIISGPGLIGEQHAKLINDRQDCRLGAIVLPTAADHEFVANKFKCSVFSSLEEAFRSEEFDAAIISSPNDFHFEQTMQCIKLNIPVLVEKPITDNLITAKKLVEASSEYNAKILVGHHRTYSPLLKIADSFIKSAKFGDLISVHGSALFYKPDSYFVAGPWRSKLGGGPLFINMVHEVGVLRYLCGEIRRVAALASHDARGFEVEDTVAINIEFESGALGTFILSDAAASNKSWEMTSGENRSYPYYPEDSCYFFSGSNGSLDFPAMKARFYDKSAPSWWSSFTDIVLDAQRADPLCLQLDHFMNVVRGCEEPIVSAFDGFMNIAVIDAIRRSIENGNVQEVKF